ncbi:hypothetical protein F3Y22_tig00112370pilonHSYRG00016 [Hibiscus syriacus]|uniref:TIR domain-containing protein n=1 Tax=Hibiscus syriacus TaxID=106335 RepID=A0A6A2Y8Q6_HIBSY|nr:hypothetical protein F3Y22_tig00112370pilonHSYRG00016 [Hibiscus syriacus]
MDLMFIHAGGLVGKHSFFSHLELSDEADVLAVEGSVSDGETLVSALETFELGFFSPGKSRNRYLRIWYKNSIEAVVWVANRNNPIADTKGVLTVRDGGNLVLLDRKKSVVWSSNVSGTAERPVAQLLDTGNLVLKDNKSMPERYLWQSFDSPSDTLLAGMTIGWNLKTGEERYLTSWKSADDSSPGNFTYQLDRTGLPESSLDALKRGGIVTFRDDPKLEAGEEVAPELFKAIQQSWCSVIVFSETNAFSGCCLEELAEIVKQKNVECHEVFPIFYNVDPSDLRKQKEKIEEAFVKHEERFKEDKDKIQRWRNALTQVANIKGWHLNDRQESEFIGDIVRKISTKLCRTYPVVIDELIGINSRLEESYSKIEIGEDDVRIIGICAMGGHRFITDVREVPEKCGLVALQKQLLSQIFFEEGFNFFNVHEGNSIISRGLSHRKPLYKLKVINLKGSQNLIEVPDIAVAPGLETLILEGCSKIVDVHPSIGMLKRLKLLNLKGCKSLRNLPTKIRMESLETFILSGCSNLRKFSDTDGKMECLLKLYLEQINITQHIEKCLMLGIKLRKH